MAIGFTFVPLSCVTLSLEHTVGQYDYCHRPARHVSMSSFLTPIPFAIQTLSVGRTRAPHHGGRGRHHRRNDAFRPAVGSCVGAVGPTHHRPANGQGRGNIRRCTICGCVICDGSVILKGAGVDEFLYHVVICSDCWGVVELSTVRILSADGV